VAYRAYRALFLIFWIRRSGWLALRGLPFGCSGSFRSYCIDGVDGFDDFGDSGDSGGESSTGSIKRSIGTTKQAMTGLRSRLTINKTMTGLK
jgi:hypothetical protein